jgi:small subunit ribosomal protein S25e
MPKAVEKKSKDKIQKAASQSKKSKKKKWSKGKVAEKVNHAVFLSNEGLADIMGHLIRLGNHVSVSGLVEKFKVSGSLARTLLRRAEGEGLLRRVDAHSKQALYTCNAAIKQAAAAAEAVKDDKKDKKKKK